MKEENNASNKDNEEVDEELLIMEMLGEKCSRCPLRGICG